MFSSLGGKCLCVGGGCLYGVECGLRFILKGEDNEGEKIYLVL